MTRWRLLNKLDKMDKPGSGHPNKTRLLHCLVNMGLIDKSVVFDVCCRNERKMLIRRIFNDDRNREVNFVTEYLKYRVTGGDK